MKQSQKQLYKANTLSNYFSNQTDLKQSLKVVKKERNSHVIRNNPSFGSHKEMMDWNKHKEDSEDKKNLSLAQSLHNNQEMRKNSLYHPLQE